MTLLLVYLGLAIGVSFLCSLCEAALLTLTAADAEVMVREGRRGGKRLRVLKESIDRPLAAILTLNTIAHTVGAAGVGAESLKLFGDAYVAVTSAILTLLVLVVSEIIPKTIGASHARGLAGVTVTIVRGMMWITYPVVFLLDALSRLFKGAHGHGGATREQIEVLAEMARRGGELDADESALLKNMLDLQQTRVRDVMTPRVVTFMLDGERTVDQVLSENAPIRFSRIPVTGEGPDDVRGIVLKSELQQLALDGAGDRAIGTLARPLVSIPEVATLLDAMKRFRDTGDHVFLVVDEFGGTEGVVTLEDVMESILGREIVDETDAVADMRSLAISDASTDDVERTEAGDGGDASSESATEAGSDTDTDTDSESERPSTGA